MKQKTQPNDTDEEQAHEQTRKEEQKGYMINRRNLIKTGAAATGSATVLGGAQKADLNPVGDAEAFGPLAPAAALTFAYVSVSETQGSYDPRDWFSESGSSIDKEVSETKKTLQEATHQNAISSEGTNTQYLDNYDNDLRFIEATVEQLIDQKVIGNFGTYTAESGVVNDAETVTSNHLEKTVNTVLETYNYNALNAKQIMDNLDTAGFSGQYGAVNYVTASSYDEIKNKADSVGTNGIPLFENPVILNITGDITMSNSGTTGIAFNSSVFVLSNGNTLSTSLPYSLDFNAEYEVYNTTVDAEIIVQTSSGNIYNSTIAAIDGGTGAEVYLENTTINGTNAAAVVSSPLSVNALNTSVTLDPADISTTVTTTGVTNKAEETVSLPAVEKTLNTSYYSGSNPARLAIPYDTSAGAFVDHTTQSLVVKTTTSGNSGYAEILPMAEYNSIINRRDTLSGQAYTSAQTYASNLWTDYVSTNDSVGQLSDKERADFASLVRDINKDNPRSIIQSYVTGYDGLLKPYTTEVEVTGASSGDVYTGALFSTDLANLTTGGTISKGDVLDVDGGSNAETFASVTSGEVVTVSNKPLNTITSATNGAGTDVSADVNIVSSDEGTVEYVGSSTIDLNLQYDYGVSRTFVVDPNAKVAAQDLTGEDFKVTAITQGSNSVNSVDVRTYNFQDTDLSKTVEALKDLEVTVNKTSGGGGGGLFGSGIPWWAQAGILGGGAYALYQYLSGDAGGGKQFG